VVDGKTSLCKLVDFSHLFFFVKKKRSPPKNLSKKMNERPLFFSFDYKQKVRAILFLIKWSGVGKKIKKKIKNKVIHK